MSSLLKDDFYEYVNGAWLETAEIPEDKPATGGFQDLVDEIDRLLMKEFEDFSQHPETIPPGRLQDAVAYYDLAKDYESRDRLGATPLRPLLERVTALENLEDLNRQLVDWVLEGLPLPFDVDVDQDMKNTRFNTFFAGPAGTILPDKTYYDEDNAQGPQLLDAFGTMTRAVLEKLDYSKEQAATIVSEALAFDRLIVPHVRSSEENADYSKNYNPRTFDEFTNYSQFFDLRSLTLGLIGQEPEKIIVTEPDYFTALDEIANPTTFPLMKSWLLIQVALAFTGYLSEELRVLGGTYSRQLSGATAPKPQDKAAFYLANGRFSQVVGEYYGRKYFGPKAKADVEHMVKEMIAIYQERLEHNTWLSEATCQKAIVKLGTLGIHVGYPEKIPAFYDRFHTKPKSEGGTLVGNARRFARIVREDRFSKYGQAKDREEWEMSAATVNAYYHPFLNVIVFPAAILQAPFYSLEQSKSANYGGIGAVIAHEISHAFDNNGAKFDEFGNMNNWWTEADLAQFENLSQAMIAEFDGLPYAGGKVNGILTVSENIADAGGLSCALAAAKKEDQVSLEDFFTNWAKIWRSKARPQYEQLLLAIDVHAPAKLRGNIQLQNIDDFYTTYDINEQDGMYLTPEKRVHIW